MKYFPTPDEAINYVEAYPRRCMMLKGVKNPVDKETLQIWRSELMGDFIPVEESKAHADPTDSPSKPINRWLYVFAFLAIFAINFIFNPDPDAALKTLISSVIQGVGLLTIVFISLGMKKLLTLLLSRLKKTSAKA